MKLGEALSTVEETLKVEYFKDSSGKITAKYNGKTMSLDEFEKLAETDKDAKALVTATGKQNKYYPKQVKRYKDLVADLFHKKNKTPDIKIDKGKMTIYTGRKVSSYGEPKVDTKEIKTSGSKDLVAPPWMRRD